MQRHRSFRRGILRWVKFNSVGAVGVGVQLAILTALLKLGVGVFWAVIVAVEAAILHNFIWHQAWTWRDRLPDARDRMGRLFRFHAGNGLVSLGCNLAVVSILIHFVGLSPVVASGSAIAVGGLVNFLLSDRWVFARRRRS